MTTMSSLAGGKSKKAPFYHIAHPFEAYSEGHNTYLGQMYDNREVFEAFNYYLPMEVVKLIPVLNDYFNTLITETNINPERQRRKSVWSSIDTAVGVLHRISHLNSMDEIVYIGSRHLKPVTWAVIGKGTPKIKLYKFLFQSIYSVIESYTRRYKEPCHCHPVCVYHQKPYREMLVKLTDACPNDNPLSANSFLAAAIHFMVDLLEYGGPDCTEFFDLFTNDLTCSPDDVDLILWRKARERALYGNLSVRETPRQRTATAGAGTWASPPQLPAPPPKKPTRVKVTITNEGDELFKDAKTTKFQAIVITYPEADLYSEYYY